ncbi:MAG: protein kinase [Anaerolineaceae bacterium]|nr:protein kinase [Anaerolineaceae bacterium]
MQKVELGTVLKERYKIVKQLGAGGMGEVFLAQDESLDTQVAIKINHNLNESTSAQFIREARLLASLKHPNLPRVIDYFTENDTQYLVMDYIPGDDLKTIVERKDKLNPELIVKWAVELGNALTYLHNRKPPIFHRDIKPANIKLTPGGDVLLVDFGIAKTGDPSTETQTGAWAFSPGFAPPEQISGLRTGPYSDQYSLAATIYYLFSGKPPVDAAQRMMGAALFTPLNMAVPSVPLHVSEAVSRALAIKPEDRFANISEFLTALTNPQVTQIAQGDQKTVIASRYPPILPPTPANAKSNKPTSRKSPLGWIFGILIFAGVVIGGYLAFTNLGILQPLPFLSPAATATATTAPTLTQEPTLAETPAEAATATTEAIPTATAEVATATAEITALPANSALGRGGKIAFISNRQGDGINQVWLMNVEKDADGKLVATNVEQLTFSPGEKSQPAWSPDGTKLLYVGVSTDFAKNGTPFAKDIWVLDLNNKDAEAVDLTKRAGDDVDPAWSPSGKLIAFTSYYREDNIPQMFLMNSEGYDQKRISERFGEEFPTWTPNDDYLYYTLVFDGHEILSMRDRWSLYVNQKKFDMTSDTGRLGNALDAQITLDGQTLLYTQLSNGDQNIFTAPVKDRGKNSVQLTDTGKDYAACWSPDAQWIVFTSDRDDNSEIYIMDASGENVTNLTNHPGLDKDPAWQPPQAQQ